MYAYFFSILYAFHVNAYQTEWETLTNSSSVIVNKEILSKQYFWMNKYYYLSMSKFGFEERFFCQIVSNCLE